LSYQWYYNTTVRLLNQTGTNLVLNNIQLGNAGDYTVVITNAVGAVTSTVARLTVTGGQATRPQLAGFQMTGRTFGFSFTSESGRTYTLQYTDSLTPINWQPVPGATVSGDGTVKSLSEANQTRPMRFYRVRVD
jgi:hypothetical protein